MSQIGQVIAQSLKDAIEYEDGDKTKGRSMVYYLEPMPEFETEEIKQIYNAVGMTQAFFAGTLGV